jgi:GxxExxY protein
MEDRERVKHPERSERAIRPLLEAATTGAIIDSFRDVHRALGFGYREHICALALERELSANGHHMARQVRVMVYDRGEPLTWPVFDMVVDEKVIVEHKATERLPADASAQLFSYLSSTNLEVGLMLHFGRRARVLPFDL